MSERKIGSIRLQKNRGENVRTCKNGESKLSLRRQGEIAETDVGDNRGKMRRNGDFN